MKDVMIDLETFGNGEYSCIVQIGACYFDRKTGEIGETFAKNVDAGSCLAQGGKVDASTLYWWLSQSPEAIASIMKTPLEHISVALLALNEFLKNAECIWSHATFDFVVVMSAFKNANIKPSFSYRAARDIRTLTDLAGVDTRGFKREGIHHNGLDDAKFQVSYCVEALQKLAAN